MIESRVSELKMKESIDILNNANNINQATEIAEVMHDIINTHLTMYKLAKAGEF